MSSPRGARRLSTAFDNFRNKCRRTRIDSLLSPPKPDSGAEESPSQLEGVPLTGDDDIAYKSKTVGEQAEFLFASDLELGLDSDVESPEENKRLTAALADFTGEATSPEEFERYFSEYRRQQSEQISPTGSMDTGASETSPRSLTTAGSGSTMEFEIGVPLERTVAQHHVEYQTQVQTEPQTQEQSLVQSTYISLDQIVQDAGWTVQEQRNVPKQTVDGMRLDGRPLLRHTGTAAPPHSCLSVPTYSDFAQQSSSSLDVHLQFEGFSQTHYSGGHAEISEMRSTLDAPPDLPQDIGLTPAPRQQRARPVSWFSNSSEEDEVYNAYPDHSHLRHVEASSYSMAPPPAPIPQHQQQTRHFLSKRQRTINNSRFDGQEKNSSNPSAHVPSLNTNPFTNKPSLPSTSFPHPPTTEPTEPALPLIAPLPKRPANYAHTPPTFLPPHRQQLNLALSLASYTSLHSPHAIQNFHLDLCNRLHTAIATGGIRAAQIPVKERVRRLSGAKMAYGGAKVVQGARRMSRGMGKLGAGAVDAVAGVGTAGVGWGSLAREAEREGRV